MEYNFYFKSLLIFLLFLVTFLLLKSNKNHGSLPAKNTGFYLFALLVLIFFVRYCYMEELEANIDTSTWLSGMHSINRYSSWIWTLFNYTDSRPLTVLPLVMASWTGIHIGYIASECIGLIFMLTTTFFLYKICLYFLPQTASLIITWGFCLLIGTTFVTDYTAYNSEQLSVLLLTAITYSYLSYADDHWNNNWLVFTIGLTIGSLVYVKFQNVPMGLLITASFSIKMLSGKRWKNLFIFIAGGVVPTLILNLYYFSKGKLAVFWNNYFWNYFYYSYTTQFSNIPIRDRFNLARIFRFIYLHDDSKWYFLILTVILIIGFLFSLKARSGISIRQKRFFLFFLMYNSICLYAILQSGNPFAHYKLYLWAPMTILTGIIISIFPLQIQKSVLVFLLFCTTLVAGKNIFLKSRTNTELYSSLDEKVISSITRNSSNQEPIIVWGWRDQLYVKAKRPMGYRDAHTFHFALKSRLVPFWTADFLNDIHRNKPSIFIDVTANTGYSTFAKILTPYHQIPRIKNYIARHYSLIEIIDGVRIYKRKQ